MSQKNGDNLNRPATDAVSTGWLAETGSVRSARILLLVWSAAVAVLSPSSEGAVRIVAPTNGTIILQPTNVPLNVRISIDVTHDFNAPTDLYDGTNLLGSTSLRQHNSLTWSNVAFGDHALLAIHRPFAGPVTSSVVRLRVDYGGWALVRPGAAWFYRDGGVDLGTDWRGTNVDLSEWPQGPAKLGFGDDDVATWVAWLDTAKGEVYPTYYFRHAFWSPSPSALSNAAVRLRRDDGAIVYLNGEEVFRDNMPDGAVNHRTYALGAVSNEDEFIQRWLNPARLHPGTNHLAVEIHNSGPQSHDIGFDLAVIADIPTPPVSLAIQRDDVNVLLSWPIGFDGYTLESATGMRPGGLLWERLTNRASTAAGRVVHSNRVDAAMRFFRLRLE